MLAENTLYCTSTSIYSRLLQGIWALLCNAVPASTPTKAPNFQYHSPRQSIAFSAIWAVNLGLFVVGHGSLDYRVREAERLLSSTNDPKIFTGVDYNVSKLWFSVKSLNPAFSALFICIILSRSKYNMLIVVHMTLLRNHLPIGSIPFCFLYAPVILYLLCPSQRTNPPPSSFSTHHLPKRTFGGESEGYWLRQ